MLLPINSHAVGPRNLMLPDRLIYVGQRTVFLSLPRCSQSDLSDRGSPEPTMNRETPRAEVLRLIKELRKTRQDEIFGGLSLSERADYDKKANRISELELLFLSFFSEPDSNNSAAWDKMSETDSPQSLARQPYRSREKDSHDSQAQSDSRENPTPKGAITDDE
jgi:hypothetical protein